MHATFIRAPWVESCDPDVEVLATAHTPTEHIVAVRYRHCIATAFHPEISGENRVHELLIDVANKRLQDVTAPRA
jgi:5'-phosphate synthase pdxT subunit